MTWVGVEKEQVFIHDPYQLVEWYATPSETKRAFCKRCGSSMFFSSPKWPGELHITRANFSDPIDREPQMHGYYDTHVSWFSVSDNLPKKTDPQA